MKVVPGGSRDAVLGPHGGRLRIKVAAAAEGGGANRAVLALLADRLGVSPRSLTILRGERSPLKTIRADGLDADAVVRQLGVDR